MILMLQKVLGLFILASFSPLSFAAEQTDLASKTLRAPPVSSTALIETLLGLLLVLAIIVLLAWLLRKTGQFQGSANNKMQIVASLALGPRERAVLLNVGKEQILIGVTSQQVQTLHVLKEPIDIDNTPSNSASFAEKLQQMMQQKGKS